MSKMSKYYLDILIFQIASGYVGDYSNISWQVMTVTNMFHDYTEASINSFSL